MLNIQTLDSKHWIINLIWTIFCIDSVNEVPQFSLFVVVFYLLNF